MNAKKPTSQWEVDIKENRVFLIVSGIVTVLIGMAVFNFNTYLKAFAERASSFDNIAGGLCIFGSWLVLFFGIRLAWPASAKVAWFGLLILGLCWACGFNFDLRGIPDIP